MHLDIVIFAVIAAFLLYRLNAALGTRHGEERPRRNPFATNEAPPPPLPAPKPRPAQQPAQWIDPSANREGRVEAGLDEIAAADPDFDVSRFMEGAKNAFGLIVTAYGKGSRDDLRPLLSPKLYADFDAGISAREAAGGPRETENHRIRGARIVAAHLGGTMAYVTVDYDVERTTTAHDVSSVEDIWTFTRDLRSTDPNWILIETASAEK